MSIISKCWICWVLYGYNLFVRFFVISWLGILDGPKLFVYPLCSLYYKVPQYFLFLEFLLCLTFSLAIEDILACILQLQQWNYVGKTLAQNAHRSFLRAKAARSLLLLKAHVSPDDVTALHAVSPTDGLIVITWRFAHLRVSPELQELLSLSQLRIGRTRYITSGIRSYMGQDSAVGIDICCGLGGLGI